MVDKKNLGTCGILDVLRRLWKMLRHSNVSRHEFPIMAGLSFVTCVTFFLLKPIVNIVYFENVIDPYVTLLGFSLSTFAIFISEVKDLETLANKLENADMAINDFVSLSIIGLLMPLIGVVPNLITIPGFHIYFFQDNQYWNVFFCSMSVLWIVNSIIHVISIKIINI